MIPKQVLPKSSSGSSWIWPGPNPVGFAIVKSGIFQIRYNPIINVLIFQDYEAAEIQCECVDRVHQV